MKINFEITQKISPFKILKQPGILSFDRVFLNTLNLGLSLVFNNKNNDKQIHELLKTKINFFKTNLEKYSNTIPAKWFNQIQQQISDCLIFLDNIDEFTPQTFQDSIQFIEQNTQILTKLSSIWFLTYQTKKPCLCESRKIFLYDMLKNNNAGELISETKPTFSCQEIIVDSKKWYFLLPTNWDVVDYFVWIKQTNYWENYWNNVRIILKQSNNFNYQEIVLGSYSILEPNQPIKCLLYSSNSYLCFNYVVASRGCKNYQENFNFINDIQTLGNILICDCINGYFIFETTKTI